MFLLSYFRNVSAIPSDSSIQFVWSSTASPVAHLLSLYSSEKQEELAGCIIFSTISESLEGEVHFEISVAWCRT